MRLIERLLMGGRTFFKIRPLSASDTLCDNLLIFITLLPHFFTLLTTRRRLINGCSVVESVHLFPQDTAAPHLFARRAASLIIIPAMHYHSR